MRSTTTKGSAIDPLPVTCSSTNPPNSSEKEMPRRTIMCASACCPRKQSNNNAASARLAWPPDRDKTTAKARSIMSASKDMAPEI